MSECPLIYRINEYTEKKHVLYIVDEEETIFLLLWEEELIEEPIEE